MSPDKRSPVKRVLRQILPFVDDRDVRFLELGCHVFLFHSMASVLTESCFAMEGYHFGYTYSMLEFLIYLFLIPIQVKVTMNPKNRKDYDRAVRYGFVECFWKSIALGNGKWISSVVVKELVPKLSRRFLAVLMPIVKNFVPKVMRVPKGTETVEITLKDEMNTKPSSTIKSAKKSPLISQKKGGASPKSGFVLPKSTKTSPIATCSNKSSRRSNSPDLSETGSTVADVFELGKESLELKAMDYLKRDEHGNELRQRKGKHQGMESGELIHSSNSNVKDDETRSSAKDSLSGVSDTVSNDTISNPDDSLIVCPFDFYGCFKTGIYLFVFHSCRSAAFVHVNFVFACVLKSAKVPLILFLGMWIQNQVSEEIQLVQQKVGREQSVKKKKVKKEQSPQNEKETNEASGDEKSENASVASSLSLMFLDHRYIAKQRVKERAEERSRENTPGNSRAESPGPSSRVQSRKGTPGGTPESGVVVKRENRPKSSADITSSPAVIGNGSILMVDGMDCKIQKSYRFLEEKQEPTHSNNEEPSHLLVSDVLPCCSNHDRRYDESGKHSSIINDVNVTNEAVSHLPSKNEYLAGMIIFLGLFLFGVGEKPKQNFNQRIKGGKGKGKGGKPSKSLIPPKAAGLNKIVGHGGDFQLALRKGNTDNAIQKQNEVIHLDINGNKSLRSDIKQLLFGMLDEYNKPLIAKLDMLEKQNAVNRSDIGELREQIASNRDDIAQIKNTFTQYKDTQNDMFDLLKQMRADQLRNSPGLSGSKNSSDDSHAISDGMNLRSKPSVSAISQRCKSENKSEARVPSNSIEAKNDNMKGYSLDSTPGDIVCGASNQHSNGSETADFPTHDKHNWGIGCEHLSGRNIDPDDI